jgi:rubrerythrin
MTPAEIRLLQDAYRRECRSLLQYVREAAPYTSVADRPVRDRILHLAADESKHLDALAERLEVHRIPLPNLGSFPAAFTDLNFVTVRHLLPKLVAEQKADVARLEADAAACTDVVAKAAIEALVGVHRGHLKELESLV